MVEVLSGGRVECHGSEIAILRMRNDISHADNDRTRNEHTGHIPGSGMGRVGGSSCIPNRRLQNILQEVGSVGPRGVESVAVSSRGTETLQTQKVYEQGQSRPERPLQFNGRGV